jgi:hypothetical protein
MTRFWFLSGEMSLEYFAKLINLTSFSYTLRGMGDVEIFNIYKERDLAKPWFPLFAE